MGPVVPILRLTYLFLNIYDTYKVLKIPPPSPRNGGQPSIRSMTQRKRDMKGIMTIWIVWVCFQPPRMLYYRPTCPDRPRFPLWQCCITTYEKTVDPLIIYFPFYDEIKSIFLLFFIFTRARVSRSPFSVGLRRSRLGLANFEPSTSIQLGCETLHPEHVSFLIGCRTGLPSRNQTFD